VDRRRRATGRAAPRSDAAPDPGGPAPHGRRCGSAPGADSRDAPGAARSPGVGWQRVPSVHSTAGARGRTAPADPTVSHPRCGRGRRTGRRRSCSTDVADGVPLPSRRGARVSGRGHVDRPGTFQRRTGHARALGARVLLVPGAGRGRGHRAGRPAGRSVVRHHGTAGRRRARQDLGVPDEPTASPGPRAAGLSRSQTARLRPRRCPLVPGCPGLSVGRDGHCTALPWSRTDRLAPGRRAGPCTARSAHPGAMTR